MRDDVERLLDIIGAIEDIERYATRGYDAYLQDELLRVWMLHHIQVIGEAAAHVSQSIREQYSTIPWTDVVSMRNVLVHHYFGIDVFEVWDTVTNDLPVLKKKIQAILRDLTVEN